MQQHIYFAPVSEDVANEFDTFELEGTHYDFYIEVNPQDEFIRLYDAIGRMVPIDSTELDSAIAALQLAKELLDAKNVTVFTVDEHGDVDFVEGE